MGGLEVGAGCGLSLRIGVEGYPSRPRYGFRGWGFGIRDEGSGIGFRSWGFGIGEWGSGISTYRLEIFELRVQRFRFGAYRSGFRVWRVERFGIRGLGSTTLAVAHEGSMPAVCAQNLNPRPCDNSLKTYQPPAVTRNKGPFSRRSEHFVHKLKFRSANGRTSGGGATLEHSNERTLSSGALRYNQTTAPQTLQPKPFRKPPPPPCSLDPELCTRESESEQGTCGECKSRREPRRRPMPRGGNLPQWSSCFVARAQGARRCETDRTEHVKKKTLRL